MAIEPELEFVPEQEQDLEFAPLSQEEAGNLTKADYLASGGAPEDVISPEREAVLQQETQRQLQAGATPQQASIEAGKAVDAMGAIRRPDGDECSRLSISDYAPPSTHTSCSRDTSAGSGTARSTKELQESARSKGSRRKAWATYLYQRETR